LVSSQDEKAIAVFVPVQLSVSGATVFPAGQVSLVEVKPGVVVVQAGGQDDPQNVPVSLILTPYGDDGFVQ
jgi:hypothetical protein